MASRHLISSLTGRSLTLTQSLLHTRLAGSPLVTTAAVQRALMSSSVRQPTLLPSSLFSCHRPTQKHQQQQQSRSLSSGDKELVQHLEQEIGAENSSLSASKLPSRIGSFDVKLDQAEISLVRQLNNEQITVSMSVNFPEDADVADEAADETDPASGQQSAGARRGRLPAPFSVDIVRDGKTVSFTCSFTHDYDADEAENDEYSDQFCIDEIVMYEGECNDKCYSVSGSIIDGDLYDLLMNTLEERGVDNRFVQELSEFCTNYEQRCYVALLQGLRSFYSKH